ncbi:uncharacterized protein RJT21DRAFT_117372 [Scheffersomyces amazonensis]|uniref:uncharacterized protein n=1 Tax=Scheffersomyces amazonensis TaxID=1078765 RepID=UPI00315CE589
MNSGWLNLVWKRTVHHKVTAKKYPQVNIKDVVLQKPSYGFRRQRKPLISQGVKDTLFPNSEIAKRYVEAGKPVPIKYRTNSDHISRRNFMKYQDEIANNKPHFKVGEKKVYFPKGRICLLEPDAKYGPYQARFLVPKAMNKMDLRDYLWHIYGLRALTVTSQLTPAYFTRGPFDLARSRRPQLKIMTIEMEQPFIWPENSPAIKSLLSTTKGEGNEANELATAINSDKLKPNDAYGGMYLTPELPNAFIPNNFKRLGSKTNENYYKQLETKPDRKLVKDFLGL